MFKKIPTPIIIILGLIIVTITLFIDYQYLITHKKSQTNQIKQTHQVKQLKQVKEINQTKNNTIKIIKENYCNNCLVCINKDILWKNIKKYKNISDNTRKEILNAIYKYSEEYNINPVIIYSIIATESSFRFWIRHSPVVVTVNGRRIRTQAIGLGAVIWEWWGDKLQKENIAQVKSDLFKIDTNIHATCYIYNQLRNMPPVKGLNKDDSAKLRYFGGGLKNKWYVNKINTVTGMLLQDALGN